MKYLYKNFLRDKRIYNLNEAFYKRLLKAATGSEASHFFKPAYGNGQKIYDEHIFSTKYNERILQIIQREPVSKQPVLNARVKKWDEKYDLLVLSLELSDAVKPALEKIVKAWLAEGASFEEIRLFLPRPAALPYDTEHPTVSAVREDTPDKSVKEK